MSKCNCNVCQEYRRFKEIILTLNKEDKVFLESMYDAHVQEGEDALWFKSKYAELKRKHERLDQI